MAHMYGPGLSGHSAASSARAAGARCPSFNWWRPCPTACEHCAFVLDAQDSVGLSGTRALLKLRGGGRGISAILAHSSVGNAWDDSLSESSEDRDEDEDEDEEDGDEEEEGSDDDDVNTLNVVSMSPSPAQNEHEDEEDDMQSSVRSESQLSTDTGSSSRSSRSSSSSSSSNTNSGSSSGDSASEEGDGESEADSDEELHMMSSLSSPRSKVTTYTSCTGDLRHVVDLLRSSHRIIVVTGAGMSASCGIPTFRGQGQLYDSVAKEFGLAHGHEVPRGREREGGRERGEK